MARKVLDSAGQGHMWKDAEEEAPEVKKVSEIERLFYNSYPRKLTVLNLEGLQFEAEYIDEFMYSMGRCRSMVALDNEELRIVYGCSKGTVSVYENPWSGYYSVVAWNGADMQRWDESYTTQVFMVGKKEVRKSNRMEIFEQAISFAKKVLLSVERS